MCLHCIKFSERRVKISVFYLFDTAQISCLLGFRRYEAWFTAFLQLGRAFAEIFLFITFASQWQTYWVTSRSLRYLEYLFLKRHHQFP